MSSFLKRDTDAAPPDTPNAILRDIINLGTLEPRKNQEHLIRVLAAARDLGKQYTLTLVGDGPDRRKLQSLVNRLGLTSQVEFAGGLPGGARLLNSHRIYCHSALMDNLPLALIEALAHGRPILAGPVGGIPEIFRDGVEGYYWALDDPAACASKLVQLLENPALLRSISEAAKKHFADAFDPEVIGKQLSRFLFECRREGALPVAPLAPSYQ